MLAPILGQDGTPVYFIGTQQEVVGPQMGAARLHAARRRVLSLSPKQRRLLALTSQGLRDAQAGAEMGISESAVKRLRSRMLKKLQVATSAEAVRLGVEAEIALEQG